MSLTKVSSQTCSARPLDSDDHQYINKIPIDPNGDLLLEVIEYDYSIYSHNGKYPVLETASFRVSRQKLLEKHCAPHIKNQLQTAPSISIDKYSIGAVELWMRCFHETLTEEFYTLPIKDVWNAIAFGRDSDFDMNDLEDWPARYFDNVKWNSIGLDDIRQLLYPALALDEARAFAIASRRLALQGYGHITELSGAPRFYQLHVPSRVIGT